MRHAAQHQRGQSTVEFAILSAALIPFLLALGLMAKAGDIQHAAAQASQYSVWERAQNPGKNPVLVGEEVRARFFTQTARTLVDQETITDSAPEYRPYWVDHGNRRLLIRFSDVRKNDTQSGLQAAKQAFDVAAKIFVSGMNLNQDGMWRARVQVPLQTQPSQQLAPFDRLKIVPEASSALLSNSWTAANKHAIKKTISDWRVTTTDPVLTLAVQSLAYLFSFLDLEANPSSFKNKNVDHDVIPCELRMVKGQTTC